MRLLVLTITISFIHIMTVGKLKIKAVLGMLARGTETRKYGPMAEEAGSACDCKTKHCQ